MQASILQHFEGMEQNQLSCESSYTQIKETNIPLDNIHLYEG